MKCFNCLVAFLLCLSFYHVTAINSLEEFGEKFGSELKTLTVQLAENLINNFNKFYEAILQEASTTEAESKDYNESLDALRNINARLQSNDEQTIKAALLDLISKEFRKLRNVYRASPTARSKSFEKYGNDVAALLSKYLADLNVKWHELLMQVPAEEQAQHSEYSTINQHIKSMTIHDDDTFLQTMGLIFKTFGYEADWGFLLEDIKG